MFFIIKFSALFLSDSILLEAKYYIHSIYEDLLDINIFFVLKKKFPIELVSKEEILFSEECIFNIINIILKINYLII